MEKIVQQCLLYDFYGELLTSHQKEVYEDFVYNNYSITEIAEEYGISKQAASDLIKRINRLLEEYEEKLQLVTKFERIKDKIEAIDSLDDDVKQDILKEL